MEEISFPKIQTLEEKKDFGLFVIEPLYPGFGQTVGNALRRVLLSSLEGAAISQVKIEGVDHEFSTVPGIKEDVIEILINLKQLRMKLFSDEPVTMTLNAKGSKEVKAKDIKAPSQVEIINKDLTIAHLDNSKSTLLMEMMVEKGRGYLPVEMRPEKSGIGIIQIDSLFSPVLAVNFKVENTRVGQRTDFNKITLEVTTDGTVKPSEALKKSAEILVKQFDVLTKFAKEKEEKEKKLKPKKTKEPKEKKEKKEKKARKVKEKKSEKTTKKKRIKKSPA